MKKILLITLAGCALAAGIYSCTKQDTMNGGTQAPAAHTGITQTREQTFEEWYALNESRLNEVSRSEIIAFDNIETQKSIFNVLPADRKAYVWKEKYNELLAAPGYTQAQQDFFRSCVSWLSVDLYGTGDYLSNNHNDIQSLRATGETLFTREQLVIIMAFLGNSYKQWQGSNADACECSVKSDWCDFPIDIGGHCDGNACNRPSSSGCGTWWAYSCTGDCVI